MLGRLSTQEMETFDVPVRNVTYAWRVPFRTEFFLVMNLAKVFKTAGFVYSVAEVRDSLTIVCNRGTDLLLAVPWYGAG